MFMEYRFFKPDLEGHFAIINLWGTSSISVTKCGCLFSSNFVCILHSVTENQVQSPGNLPLRLRENGSILKFEFDIIRGAGVYRCSCVFLLNWKQTQCLLRFACFYPLATLLYAKPGHLQRYVRTNSKFADP
jgi:hypothetical protein